MNGTVISFDAADSLGWIELDDGRKVRFGLTACGRLSPAAGLRVRVGGLREEGGTLKAGQVRGASLFSALRSRPNRNGPLARFDFSSADGRDLGAPAGLLMKWMILHALTSEELNAHAREAMARVRSGALSGRAFITEACDERPRRGDLSAEGLQFWEFLYGKPSFFSWRQSRLETLLQRVGSNEAEVLLAIDECFKGWRRG